MSKKKEETIQVTLRLPKPVYEFYKALVTLRKEESLETFLADTIINDVDSFIDDFASSGPNIVKRYGLEDYSGIKEGD